MTIPLREWSLALAFLFAISDAVSRHGMRRSGPRPGRANVATGVNTVGKIGRPKKYGSGKVLEAAVEAYFDSISYRVPVVVTTATGEVDEEGNAKVVTKMLREGADGVGAPVTQRKYLEPPSVAALCLYLGISRDTWAEYGRSAAMAAAVERTRARLEAYLVAQLEGRHVQGVIFNLKNNYGWKDKQEFGMDRETRQALSARDMTTKEKLELLRAAAEDFAAEPDA